VGTMLTAPRGLARLSTGVVLVALVSALAVTPAALAVPSAGDVRASGWNGDDSIADDGSTVNSRTSPTERAGTGLESATGGLESAAAGLVTGRLLLKPSDIDPAIIVTSGKVQFYDRFDPYVLIDEVDSNINGTFSISGLPAGSYRVAFISYMDDPYLPVREWAVDAPTYFAGGDVVLTDGNPYAFGDVVIEARDIRADRIAGANRFATAAAVSDYFLGTAVGGTVFIVNGRNFPDALSAGAATTDGALLMVEQNSVPAATQAELSRLAPDRIVVVGGTGAVSASVFAQLQSYVPAPTDVVRISGADRYATSRAVITSPDGFNGAVSELLIATGRNFPDALSAVPAAIRSGAAVLLVNGAASSLDPATLALVDDLGVPVTIIGGTGVVSAGIQSQLAGLVSTQRVSGSDRFSTSVAVAVEFFPEADWAFLANGFGFPDALAAGPLAGYLSSPVYLVRQDCVPNVVYLDVFNVLANEIVAVGGTSVVSDNAMNGLPCF